MLSEVYDIECLCNIFTYTGYCRQTKEYHQFVIHSSRNNLNEFVEHLYRDKLIMIGYNNLNYDYPIIHHILNHYADYKHLSGYEVAQKIYEKSQEIIAMEFSAIADWNSKITQIDLFKIWHYDNKAKHQSLKGLEINMNLPSVEDMPFNHNHFVKENEIDMILSYNKNDVFATNEFLNITLGDTENPLYKGKNKIELRQQIERDYKVSGMNFNDIKLGTELILKLYCEETKLNPQDVRKKSTPRPIINLKDCLPKWMEFKTNNFNPLIEKFKSTIIYNGETKEKLSFDLIYKGVKISYGTGGAHACAEPGVFKADDKFGIYDVDIDSLYPTLAISQELYPQHLGKAFLKVYRDKIVNVRLREKKKPKKERNFVIVEGFKLAANGTYGKTNEANSWLYDPLYSMKTTISGQIFISMWAECIAENIPECEILQINTDGITFKYPKKYHEKAIELSNKLTEKCKLTYECNEYKSMIIRDVNNYIAEYTDGHCKYKGCFEIDKELHKDNSMRIVPIALSEYFIKNIPFDQTIKNHKNIYDFCLRLKLNNGFIGTHNSILNSQKHIETLGKNTRYYISNKGGYLFKSKMDNSNYLAGVNVGFLTTIFNQYALKPIKDYNLNYAFYIRECRKIVDIIENKQLKLF